jgi:Domain of unknown function (DUF4386)
MAPDRRAAVTAGVLFLIATAASLLSTAIEHPVLTGTDYLAQIAANTGRVSAGGLAELVAAGASAGIAISLYPVLRKRGESLALGAVVFRALEGAMYTVGAVITLSMPAVARQYARAAVPGQAGVRSIGDALIGVRQDAILAGVFAYILGALMYYCILYRSRLIPRWLPAWGIAAEIPMLIACLLASFTGTPVTSFTILILPIAMQEIALAAWLIFRGFSPGGLQASTVTRPAPSAGQRQPHSAAAAGGPAPCGR